MFGVKKQKLEEQIRIREIFSKVAEHRENFEGSVSQIGAIRERISTDAKQVMENTNILEEYAKTNIEEETNVIRSIDGFSKELKGTADKYKKLVKLIDEQYDATISVVEENKHYTNTSRKLKEIPAAIKQGTEFQEKQLEEIAGHGNKMSVLALNAAIEAGRMGESGKQFIEVSEEIRQMAMNYENTILTLQEEIKTSRAKIEEFEDTIEHMIDLIKESNKAANRLLKKGQELKKTVQVSAMHDYSEDLVLMRDKVVGMRNLDEEIAKSGKRNKIQLSDIQEDVEIQKNILAELGNDMSQIFDVAEEQLKCEK